jgi:hypothetical protein
MAGIAHVGANRASKSIAIDAAEVDPSVCQRLRGRLPTQRNILELAGELALDIYRCAEHQTIGNAGHIRQSLNAAVATLTGLPNRFARVADSRDQPDAGDDNTIVVRRLMAH